MYGLNTSSSAIIAAYLNQMAGSLQCTDKKTKSVRAYFCCYDIFTKTDVRVEVSFPGSTQTYALGECQDKRYAIDWSNAFLSSQLRSFRAQPCYVCRVIIHEPGVQQL